MLGAAVGTAMAANATDNAYHEAYTPGGIGGLIATVLVPRLGHFGDFCLVMLALSLISCNAIDIYSIALSLQLVVSKSQHIPRFVWTVLATFASVAIAIPGYSHFALVIQNLLTVIAYGVGIYSGEHPQQLCGSS